MTSRAGVITGRVLVVEGGPAAHALAAVRALAAGGWEVGLAATSDGSRAERSRHVAQLHRVPSAQDDPGAFVQAIADVVAAAGYDVLLVADDIELMVLSAARERLACAFPHAPHDQVLRAIDKLELTHAAARAGLAAPATRTPGPEALAAFDGPVVVKARWHWEPGAAAGLRHLEATRCATADEARAAVAVMREAGREPVLQDAVDGRLMAVTTVIGADGRPVAWSQQRTLRESSRRTSSRAETVRLDERLVAGVTGLLADLRWVGLANLQFLAPDDGGPPQLIDLNGRLYGSLALAVAAGANVADVWARVGIGAPTPGTVVARPGVRFQAFGEDFARARRERRGGLAADVADTVAFSARGALRQPALRDPGPALAALGERVRTRLTRHRGAGGG